VATKVLVEADLYPTEAEDKVREAVFNLTGSRDFKRWSQGKRSYLTQEGDESLLAKLRTLIRRERILDASRKIMRRGIQGSSIKFYVNKQVAFAGHLSFCQASGESPMGPISFYISTDNPNSLIEWLATRTIDGVPVDELCQSGSRRFAPSVRPTQS
jgi:predicted RNA binding protein with dsRBD fold (UPF0201 family)